MIEIELSSNGFITSILMNYHYYQQVAYIHSNMMHRCLITEVKPQAVEW